MFSIAIFILSVCSVCQLYLNRNGFAKQYLDPKSVESEAFVHEDIGLTTDMSSPNYPPTEDSKLFNLDSVIEPSNHASEVHRPYESVSVGR